MEKDNQQYRYQLEHCRGDRRKLICPNCGHRTFVPYIDVETGEYVSTEVGRCDRENNCGYHKTPKDFFQETGDGPKKKYWFPNKDSSQSFRPSGYSTISQTLVEDSMTRLAFNNFNIWLREHFDSKKAMEATLRYKVGGHTLWPGATVFWQIDQQSRVHTGKIMLYDHHTGHRIKDGYSRITWVHSSPKFKNFHLQQCLFGLHLLTDETKTICIVEAEKTAVVASMFFPDALFLATGGISNLRPETCAPLKDKCVILFPDLGAEDNWREKAATIPGLNRCVVSNWLYNNSTPEMRAKGLDIADILEDWRPEQPLNIEDFL